MNVAGVQIAQVKLLRRGTEIAVSVHIALYNSTNRSYQSVSTDIKLAVVDQKWLIKILLNDGGPVTILG